jgi:hypothetical protein
MFVSSSNQDYLEHARAIPYSLQKNPFDGVWHAPIITLVLKGFAVKRKFPF